MENKRNTTLVCGRIVDYVAALTPRDVGEFIRYLAGLPDYRPDMKPAELLIALLTKLAREDPGTLEEVLSTPGSTIAPRRDVLAGRR
jgi:hypothetical protein